MIALGGVGVDGLRDAELALREMQQDGLPVQLHPGDLGWHRRFGRAGDGSGGPDLEPRRRDPCRGALGRSEAVAGGDRAWIASPSCRTPCAGWVTSTAAVTQPPAVKKPPVVTKLRARVRRRAVEVGLTLSETARVRIVLERCRNRRCTRRTRVAPAVSRKGKAGTNSFSLKVRKRLAPGRYRVVATPAADGRQGVAVRSAFVVRRR